MGTKRVLYLSILLALIVALAPGVVFAGTTTVQGVTLTTPETYHSCSTTGDTVTVTGLTAKNMEWSQTNPDIEFRVSGWVSGYYVLPSGGGLQEFFNYTTDTNEDFSVTVNSPPVSQWPLTDPVNGTQEIHVSLSFQIYAYDKVNQTIVEWLEPGTLGPGDDWDVFCQGTPPPPPPDDPGTGTPGYWKNHPEAWPVDSITIGEDTYTKEQVIAFINMGDGDKSLTMFRAYVAAYLNGLIGNDTSCVDGALAAAYNWLDMYEVGSGVAAKSDAWKRGEPFYMTLDAYNNGYLCAPHRE